MSDAERKARDFNPDYLCDDPNCKSRDVVRAVIQDHDEAMREAEARGMMRAAGIAETFTEFSEESWFAELAEKHPLGPAWKNAIIKTARTIAEAIEQAAAAPTEAQPATSSSSSGETSTR